MATVRTIAAYLRGEGTIEVPEAQWWADLIAKATFGRDPERLGRFALVTYRNVFPTETDALLAHYRSPLWGGCVIDGLTALGVYLASGDMAETYRSLIRLTAGRRGLAFRSAEFISVGDNFEPYRWRWSFDDACFVEAHSGEGYPPFQAMAVWNPLALREGVLQAVMIHKPFMAMPHDEVELQAEASRGVRGRQHIVRDRHAIELILHEARHVQQACYELGISIARDRVPPEYKGGGEPAELDAEAYQRVSYALFAQQPSIADALLRLNRSYLSPGRVYLAGGTVLHGYDDIKPSETVNEFLSWGRNTQNFDLTQEPIYAQIAYYFSIIQRFYAAALKFRGLSPSSPVDQWRKLLAGMDALRFTNFWNDSDARYLREVRGYCELTIGEMCRDVGHACRAVDTWHSLFRETGNIRYVKYLGQAVEAIGESRGDPTTVGLGATLFWAGYVNPSLAWIKSQLATTADQSQAESFASRLFRFEVPASLDEIVRHVRQSTPPELLARGSTHDRVTGFKYDSVLAAAKMYSSLWGSASRVGVTQGDLDSFWPRLWLDTVTAYSYLGATKCLHCVLEDFRDRSLTQLVAETLDAVKRRLMGETSVGLRELRAWTAQLGRVGLVPLNKAHSN